jgi:hypothetical protein
MRGKKRKWAIGLCLLGISVTVDDALLFHETLGIGQHHQAFAELARIIRRRPLTGRVAFGPPHAGWQHRDGPDIGNLVFARPPAGLGSRGVCLGDSCVGPVGLSDAASGEQQMGAAEEFAFSDGLSLNGQDLGGLNGGNPANFGPTGGLGNPNGGANSNGLPLGGGGGSNGGTDGTIFVPQNGGGSLIPTVPEPATWGLLILGFGFTAQAMRRRPKAAKPAAEAETSL